MNRIWLASWVVLLGCGGPRPVDPACVPACADRACGDDGCGSSCGSCASGTCSAAGRCVEQCAPACDGKQCGPDGCGGACGTCAGASSCGTAGLCVAECAPACGGKQCGPDGCGGSCGTCASAQTCDSTASCVPQCMPRCSGRQCGDDGCGGSCGTCAQGSCATDGTCTSPTNDQQLYRQLADAAAQATKLNPASCSYEVVLNGAATVLPFSFEASDVTGQPCDGLAECPYDFSFQFTDASGGSPSRSFSLIADYSAAVHPTLVRSDQVVNGNPQLTLDYTFNGYLIDRLIFVRQTLPTSQQLSVGYHKYGPTGAEVLRVLCSPVSITSGI